MTAKRLRHIENRIWEIKKQLQAAGEMRPGSLTCQYQFPQQKKGAYYQISYTHKMKSRTDYVQPLFVDQLQKEIAMFKIFKKLVDEWVGLAIEYSKLKIESQKKKISG
jgi:hypothetical protein